MGPAKNAPSVRAAISGWCRTGLGSRGAQAFAEHHQLGTLRFRILRTRADTASNNACPARRQRSLSTRNDNQLGRYEYDGNGGGVTVARIPASRRSTG